jgi:hypothetical protein
MAPYLDYELLIDSLHSHKVKLFETMKETYPTNEGDIDMTFIPKLAYELQSFVPLSEMNQHMNYHFAALKDQLTKSNDVIFHPKRSNGLNGNCFYFLQPFKGQVVMVEELLVNLEEGNVGAGEVLEIYKTPTLNDHQTIDKLSISSTKALESSLKTKEEEIIYSARVLSNINNINNIKEHEPTILIKPEDYLKLVNHLVGKRFSEKVARKITDSVLKAFPTIKPIYIMKSYERAFSKLQKRLAYPEPILSIVDYYMSLVREELNHVRNSFN